MQLAILGAKKGFSYLAGIWGCLLMALDFTVLEFVSPKPQDLNFLGKEKTSGSGNLLPPI